MKTIVTGLMILFTATASLAADAPDPSTLRQLIDEVRQLRTTLQQTLPLQMRTQILLERIRQQRDVITDLKQALDIARQESSNQARQRADLEEQEKELETQVGENTSKAEIRGIRKAIEQTKIVEGQNRDKEGECQAALLREEAHMAELTAGLEGLTAAIGSAAVNGN